MSTSLGGNHQSTAFAGTSLETWKSRVQFVLSMYGLNMNSSGENSRGELTAPSAIIESFSLDQAHSFCLVSFHLLKLLLTHVQPAAATNTSSLTVSREGRILSLATKEEKSVNLPFRFGADPDLPAITVAAASSYLAESLRAASAQSSDNTQYMSCSISQYVVQQTRELVKQLDDEGNKLINRYTVIDNLGRGAYGKVKLAVDEANCPVAIKIVRKSLLKKQEDGEDAIAREIAVMKKLKHRNVVPLYEVIDDPASEKLYMVMKYVDQGPITKLRPDSTCDPIQAERLREVTVELVSGLSYLHKRGVAHRDIKPDNILMDAAGTPYFVDFGVSAIIGKDNPNVSTVEGTATFMPPELFDDQSLKVDAFAADVWSLGVTVYLLLYGMVPFGGSNYREISTAVRTQELVFPVHAGVDACWEDLLRGMLRKDPTRRMKLKAVKKHQALQEAAVTAAEVEMAMSKVSRFLVHDEPLLKPKDVAQFSRTIRRSIVDIPRCGRRSLRPGDVANVAAAEQFPSDFFSLSPLAASRLGLAISNIASSKRRSGGGGTPPSDQVLHSKSRKPADPIVAGPVILPSEPSSAARTAAPVLLRFSKTNATISNDFGSDSSERRSSHVLGEQQEARRHSLSQPQQQYSCWSSVSESTKNSSSIRDAPMRDAFDEQQSQKRTDDDDDSRKGSLQSAGRLPGVQLEASGPPQSLELTPAPPYLPTPPRTMRPAPLSSPT